MRKLGASPAFRGRGSRPHHLVASFPKPLVALFGWHIGGLLGSSLLHHEFSQCSASPLGRGAEPKASTGCAKVVELCHASSYHCICVRFRCHSFLCKAKSNGRRDNKRWLWVLLMKVISYWMLTLKSGHLYFLRMALQLPMSCICQAHPVLGVDDRVLYHSLRWYVHLFSSRCYTC